MRIKITSVQELLMKLHSEFVSQVFEMQHCHALQLKIHLLLLQRMETGLPVHEVRLYYQAFPHYHYQRMIYDLIRIFHLYLFPC